MARFDRKPGHRFNDRQVEHLIQITNYKNRCLNISDMEALDKLMENITSILWFKREA